MTAVCHAHSNGSLAPYINPTTGKCGWERPESPTCVAAVLVPVTQREAEQRVIEAARGVEVTGHVQVGVGMLEAAIRDLDALGIPVDTEAGNG